MILLSLIEKYKKSGVVAEQQGVVVQQATTDTDVQ